MRELLFFRIVPQTSQEVPKRLARALAMVLFLIGVVVAPASASAGATAEPFEGFSVGLFVLIVLVIAFTYAMVVVVLAVFGRWMAPGPDWVTFIVPVLCVIGLGVAGYLTFVETRQVAAICGPVGDCNTVQSSPYAKLFGFLPVGLLGALGYLAILGLWTTGQFSKGRVSDLAAVAAFAFALFGVMFSIYLTYLELTIILAVCMWCLTSAVIMAVLLVLTTGPALVRLAPVEEVGS